MNNLPIKNRTSTVPPERTAARIEEMLARAGASDVRKRYEGGELRGLDFIIPTEQGVMSFRMPVDSEAAYQVLYNDRRQRRLSTTLAQQKALREQAKRTAWKLAQEWLEIQLAMPACWPRRRMTGISTPADCRVRKSTFRPLSQPYIIYENVRN